MSEGPTIDPDIRRASTLPSRFYTDASIFDRQREKVFARSWQFTGDRSAFPAPGASAPVVLLPGCLDEPVLLVADPTGWIGALSNVCTHRGNLVCNEPGNVAGFRCRYHGRRFGLDGKFQSMPEFEGVERFPSAADDLPRLASATWRQFVFASLEPSHPFDILVAELERRCGWLPIEDAVLDPARSRDYEIAANWALYCDNYLEGFHIPFVHPALAGALDYGSYRTELLPWSSLQVGVSSGGEDVFDLPPAHPDRDERIAAWYFWLFPNTMFNVYPWGISVNVVRPLSVDRTQVSFLSYVWDPSRLDRGAGGPLDRVELEDEEVVESVARGVRSRLYDRGRYSPTREQGVHHFHRLLTAALGE